MTIDETLEDILKVEGGYSNHPADRGGATNFGITEAVARANGYKGDMRALPRELALKIYRKRYVEAPGYDRIYTISQPIAAKLVDTGVNMGPSVATRFLQRSLNALNRERLDYGDVVVDGEVGPATRGALDAYVKKRGDKGVTVLLKMINSLQGERYVSLAEGRQANEAFVYGWFDKRISL